MNDKTEFAGHEKVGKSILTRAEKKFVSIMVTRIPKWLETYHLTMLTLVWSALLILFSFLAKDNLVWLTGVSLMIALQYVTDLFDGAVGRHRDTGLVKWGYYMDHFLDYVFACSMVVGYYIIAPAGMELHFLALLAITGAFMVTSFLSFAATNKFEIYFCGVGPTEFRVLIIAINTVLMFIGTGHFLFTVPLVCAVSLIGLSALVYRTHKTLWVIDMEAKRKVSDQSAMNEGPQMAVEAVIA